MCLINPGSGGFFKHLIFMTESLKNEKTEISLSDPVTELLACIIQQNQEPRQIECIFKDINLTCMVDWATLH